MRRPRCKACGEYPKRYALPLDKDGWCSRCRRAGPSRMRRIRMYQNGGSHTAEEWEELKRRTGYCCICCGSTDRKLYRDHIKPVVKGGRDNIKNIQPLCKQCNFYKAARHSMSYLGNQVVLCFCPEPSERR